MLPLRTTLLAFALLGCGTVAAAAPKQIPIEDFVRHAKYGSVKISPTGEYLAMTVDYSEQDVLVILRTSDLKPLKVNQLPDERSVGEYHWVGKERLLFNAVRKIGSYAQPFGTGEWFAVNADGTQARPLVFYGTRGATERGKAVSYGESFRVLDTLRDDDKQILMQVTSPRSTEGSNTEAVLMDVYSGRRKVVATAPRENCGFALDEKRAVRFAVCYDTRNAAGEFEEHSELYTLEGENWRKISSSHTDARALRVLGTSADGRIYATADDRKGPEAFGTLDPATGTFTTLFQDKVADPSGFIVAADGKTILGVVSEAGAPRVEMIDEDSPDAQIYLSMAQAFPGQFVNFSTATDDGNTIVVSVRSDRNPGELYLYNRKDGKARFLMANRDWINPDDMASVKPISYKTRDGLTIHGYLTLPKGSDGKNLPLIVNPHGGPIGPRDNWGFNTEAQLFANRGYATLQVNFRGSGGFGKAFMDMGHREWGGKMQDDLTDATQWAIDQGYADPDRICIYGGSYGGYASIMGVAKEPNLYACAIGYVGLYDVQIQLTKSDTSKSQMGLRYFDRTFGPTRADQDKVSPVNYVDKIKAPIMLAAGARDPRCPPEHTEALAKALERAGNPAEDVIIQSGEMHGFYKPENNLNLYTKMLAFFDRHIGQSATDTATQLGSN